MDTDAMQRALDFAMEHEGEFDTDVGDVALIHYLIERSRAGGVGDA